MEVCRRMEPRRPITAYRRMEPSRPITAWPRRGHPVTTQAFISSLRELCDLLVNKCSYSDHDFYCSNRLPRLLPVPLRRLRILRHTTFALLHVGLAGLGKSRRKLALLSYTFQSRTHPTQLAGDVVIKRSGSLGSRLLLLIKPMKFLYRECLKVGQSRQNGSSPGLHPEP